MFIVRKILLVGAVVLFGINSNVLGYFENNELEQEVSQKVIQDYKDLKDELKFAQFKTCNDLESSIKQILERYNFDKPPIYPYGEGLKGPVLLEKNGVNGDAILSVEKIDDDIDYSKTNIQKQGVDEPDILKSDGKNLFYYSSKKHKIFILETPFDGNLERAKITAAINLPKTFSHINLFLENNKLLVLANRYYRKFSNLPLTFDQRSDLVIFDVSNSSYPKLERLIDLDGNWFDARLIDNDLYIISRVWVNYWNLKDKNLDDVPQKLLKPNAYSINLKTKKFENIQNDCKNIYFFLPTTGLVKKLNLEPSFTVIAKINLNTYKTKISSILSTVDQIHVSKKNIYILQSIWDYSVPVCPEGRLCILPVEENGNTLVHKFDLKDLTYVGSNLVPGRPLNQYSMDEDYNGEFRLVASNGWNNGVNIYKFDNKLNLEDYLVGIGEKEQFRASRFIGDKLFLVTFKSVDPLFAIDLQPKLKLAGKVYLPGYSTYLHPIKVDGNKYYLLGVGKFISGGNQVEGVELTTYKIDFDKKADLDVSCGKIKNIDKNLYSACKQHFDSGDVRVKVENFKVLGGMGSETPINYNPRSFVIKGDKLILPIVLKNREKEGERCNIVKDVNGNIEKQFCYPYYKNITEFVGVKVFDVNGLKELASYDYLPKLKQISSKEGKNIENFNFWGINTFRAGYVGDVIYGILDELAGFHLGEKTLFLEF